MIGFVVAYERAEEGFAYLHRGDVEIMIEEYRPENRQWITGDLARPFGRGVNFQIEIDEVNALMPISLRGGGRHSF